MPVDETYSVSSTSDVTWSGLGLPDWAGLHCPPPCGAPAELTEPLRIFASSDGPVGWISMQCAAGHRWRITPDAPQAVQFARLVASEVGLDAPCRQVCCAGVGFADFSEDGDLAGAWRDRLAREGKLRPSHGSIHDLIFGYR